MSKSQEKKPRTLKLKYGEYYDLKITDANKNIINQVEITPTEITTEFLQLSKESDEITIGEGEDRTSTISGINRKDLEKGLSESQTDNDSDFLSWQYKRRLIKKKKKNKNKKYS